MSADQEVPAARAVSAISAAVAGAPDGQDGPDIDQLLAALSALRALRDELAAWEPLLIEAARRQGVSWAQLAPVLGVASRQAAERRYLRCRPAGSHEPGSTADERIQAERDRRAGDRAVTTWARQNSAALRRLAGRISALDGLSGPARRQVDIVGRALVNDDPAELLAPLVDSLAHLRSTHPVLADEIDTITQHTDKLRRDTHAHRSFQRSNRQERPASPPRASGSGRKTEWRR